MPSSLAAWNLLPPVEASARWIRSRSVSMKLSVAGFAAALSADRGGEGGISAPPVTAAGRSCKPDHLRAAEGKRSLDRVGQFAHVARPLIALHGVERFGLTPVTGTGLICLG